MSEPLNLEFMADDSLAGFRLQRFEAFNWGTFDGKVWTLRLDGKNCLLTGGNGSGKSTLVDGVTTLLVPSHRVAYNKAAGGDARERTLRSYVRGYFKSERQESLGSVKPVALRDDKSYSVILGVFRNSGYEKTVTLAQVFWTKDPSAQPARLYVACEEDLSILGDFSGFGKDISDLKKRLRRAGVTTFDSFPNYGGWFKRRFGIKDDQALDLFHQTVSLKSVGNLTDFVRSHMIEPFDVVSRIDALIGHFESLNSAHEAVLKAKRQLDQLEPLVDDWKRHGKLADSVRELRECREALQPWFASLKVDLLERRLATLRSELNRHGAAVVELEERRRFQKKQEIELRRSIAENGGDRLERIGQEIARDREEMERRKIRESRYRELIEVLEESPATDMEAFVRQRQGLSELREEYDRTDVETQNELNEFGVALSRERDEFRRLTSEIDGLKARRSNIDERQIAIRKTICDALSLSEEDMPFVGELVQVREDQRDWEGAAERLLRNFGLSLLVPDRHYASVEEFVDRTSLKGRLVYFHVRDGGSSGVTSLKPDSLVHKLQVKPDSPFYDWLEREFSRRFNLICCTSSERFRREISAITRSGQIKTPGGRHEKDDRFDLNDRSRYVLGWSNREKIAALEDKARARSRRMSEFSAEMKVLSDRREVLKVRLQALSGLFEYRDFREIDWRSVSLSISKLEDERKVLEVSSDRLRVLSSQLVTLEAEISKIEDLLKDKYDKKSRTEERITSVGESLEAVHQIMEQADEDLVRRFPSLERMRDDAIGNKPITLDSCIAREQEMRAWLQAKIEGEDGKIRRLREKIVKAMTEYRREWPLDTKDVDADVGSGGDFSSMLDSLRSDDLPRFEERFKELLNENTIREVANFQSQLSMQRETIKERIDLINGSLFQIDYDQGRYIRLEAQMTQDADIRDFQGDLRACTEGALTGSEESQYSESKFLQVKRIIERFKGRENYSDMDRRWTSKVTDVRNWFVFAASERWRQDDSEYEHYADSGGKSGGQKEKLAYTVLAASLAYQFGLEWGAVRSKSFRFVVIDEAFGRGSDESARFGLELFKKLNLQLLVVTPLQKIHVIEPFVSAVGFVHCEDGKRSVLRNLSIQEYHDGLDDSGRA